MANDIPPPLAKHELVLQRCLNPRAISASFATVRAHEWLCRNACYFDNLTRTFLEERTSLPATSTIIVSECYDFEEVLAYLAKNTEWTMLDTSRIAGAPPPGSGPFQRNP